MKLQHIQEAKTIGADDDAMCVIYNTRVQKFAQNSTRARTSFRLRDKLSGNVSFYKNHREAQRDIDRWKESLVRYAKMTHNPGDISATRTANAAKKALEYIDYFIPVRVTVDLPR